MTMGRLKRNRVLLVTRQWRAEKIEGVIGYYESIQLSTRNTLVETQNESGHPLQVSFTIALRSSHYYIKYTILKQETEPCPRVRVPVR
jgi:hypothetical protein